MQQKLTFPQASHFQGELKRRVDAYFAERGLSKAANGSMVAKTVFWLAFTWGSWALTLAQVVPFPFNLILWIMQGFGFACIGFNIGHDAIHGAYSEKPRVNALLSWTFDIMGASSFTWKVAHNVIHHTYTNIPGVDGDLEPGPTMVFYPQKTKWFHRFQHLYAWYLYSYIGVIWMYLKDFAQLRRGDPLNGKMAAPIDVAQLFAGKALHFGLLVVVPFFVLQQPIWQIALGYWLLLSAAGVTLAIVFQLAHVVEGIVFPRVPRVDGVTQTQMPEAWAEHQLRTTANFGVTPLSTFICGGLDFQIEHHLMPRICHCHYRALAPIVEQCAKDHGLPYVHSGSFPSAIGSHYRALKRLGRGDVEEFAVSPSGLSELGQSRDIAAAE